MNYFRRKYMSLHLQSKLTLVLLLITTIPAVIVIFFFYSRIYDMVVSYSIQQEQDASSTTAPVVEETVQNVVDLCDGLADFEFYDILFQNPLKEPLNELADSAQAAEFSEYIYGLTRESPISAVRIYADLPDEASELFSGTYTKDIFVPVREARGTYWYGILQGNNASDLYCPSFYLGTKEQEIYGDMAYIRTETIYYHGSAHTAYIVLYYTSQDLVDILSENLSLENSVSYIINERNNIVASSDVALSGIYWLNYETIEETFMSTNNFIERTILDETVYVGFYRISGPEWFMVTVLPSKPLIEQSNLLILRFALIYIAVLIFAFLLAAFFSRSITKRITSLCIQMQEVREGPPMPIESPSVHDEVGDLIDTYNYMASQINELMKEQAKSAEDLRIAEFNSLQAQINPHFLYNTLDMINWMAQQGRTSEISSAVQDLSRFYRLTLGKRQDITSIANEVEHITLYVRLQNMRFQNGITLIIDIPDDLMNYQIPKITLQPIIENAILHGILEKKNKKGTIVLTGWIEDETITLLISDDGVGMDAETLSNILSGTGQSTSGGTNIAIYNTHRRIQILYGVEYGLHYTSEAGTGTEVQIRIPARKQ